MSDRAANAEAILTGLVGPLASPDNEGARFTPFLAKFAYLLYVARLHATFGMLRKMTPWDADDTFRHRVASATTSSSSLAHFGDVLFRRLNSSLAKMTLDDAIWWRRFASDYHEIWKQIQPCQITEAVTGAQMLRSMKLTETETLTTEAHDA